MTQSPDKDSAVQPTANVYTASPLRRCASGRVLFCCALVGRLLFTRRHGPRRRERICIISRLRLSESLGWQISWPSRRHPRYGVVHRRAHLRRVEPEPQQRRCAPPHHRRALLLGLLLIGLLLRLLPGEARRRPLPLPFPCAAQPRSRRESVNKQRARSAARHRSSGAPRAPFPCRRCSPIHFLSCPTNCCTM